MGDAPFRTAQQSPCACATFEPAAVRSFRAVNRAGFMVDLVKLLPKNLIRDYSRGSVQ